MSAHTPGPWIVYDCRDHPHEPIWVGTPAPGQGLQSLIAEVSTTEGFRAGADNREANVQANARLIAAAPRLMAELRKLVRAIDANPGRIADPSLLPMAAAATLAVCEAEGTTAFADELAAIAKAEGR